VTPLAGVGHRRRCRAISAGRPPRNKGVRYLAAPPPVEEIIAVMRRAGAAPRRRP
jgi:hypothetical protein